MAAEASCWKSKISVIFVLGGPGSGNGTQCKKLAETNVHHMSVGDVLRSEIDQANSEYGAIIRENMEKGRVDPMEITVTLLKRAIKLAYESQSQTIFLLDGFPRKMDQALYFEEQIVSPSHVVYLKCAETAMTSRLLCRAATLGRFDDNEETILKRLLTFNDLTMQVIEYYMKQGKVTEVDSNKEVSSIYLDFEQCVRECGLLFQDSTGSGCNRGQ